MYYPNHRKMIKNTYQTSIDLLKELKLKNLILPAFVLGIRPLSVIIQLMRTSLINVLNQEC